MHTQSAMSIDPAEGLSGQRSSPLVTVPQIVSRHGGLTNGGVRHMLFHLGRELEDAGVVVRFGRRILIDEARFIEWLRAGNGRKIAGAAR